MAGPSSIRNFCIISHIDHGKSTLADRFLEITGTVEKTKMHEQYLDRMDLERERGITIKMAPVRMVYRPAEILNSKFEITNKLQIPNSKYQTNNLEFKDSKFSYVLNLIDTPGHSDFSYEVSRALACCEGAILVVDATQGIQAQTLTNMRLAQDHRLVIIPVVNKIDLPSAQPQKVAKEIERTFKIPSQEIIFISAKTGQNVPSVLEEIVKKIPAPSGNKEKPTRALIFDSYYDSYKGVIMFVRMFDGQIAQDDKVFLMASKRVTKVLEVGYFTPDLVSAPVLSAGEIGYIITGLKEVSECRVGDTITKIESIQKFKNLLKPKVKIQPLPGYQEPQPVVFASFFTTQDKDYNLLKSSLEKLKLNDYSLSFQPISLCGLGRGLQCGFLGLLHLEIIKERLMREFGLEIIISLPSVSYKVYKTNGETLTINQASNFPDVSEIESVEEPWARLEIVTPLRYLGKIMEFLSSKRSLYKETKYINENQIILIYEIPLSEIVCPALSSSPFYDQLKSISSGYASVDYKIIGFRKGHLLRLDILLAGERSEIFSRIVCRDEAYSIGRHLVKKLKEFIPRQMFPVKIQAALGKRIIAAETLSALRKDVTAKLYGGDYTRKLKLLEKQKKGKKKMLQIGSVSIPPETVFRLIKEI